MNVFWLRLIKFSHITIYPPFLLALLKGSAAGIEHRQVLHNLNCECVVDVGANRGQFALVARKMFPAAKIHSFEPLDEPARIFTKIFENDPNVTLYPFAIGSEKKTSTIHVAKDDDSSSLLPVTQTQSDMFPGSTERDTRQVMVLPLSQALGSVSIPAASLFKIDVQGFELEVLKGSEDILNKFSHLYIECSFIELYESQALAHEVIAWLAKRDFNLIGIHNPYYDSQGKAVQADFLFAQRAF